MAVGLGYSWQRCHSWAEKEGERAFLGKNTALKPLIAAVICLGLWQVSPCSPTCQWNIGSSAHFPFWMDKKHKDTWSSASKDFYWPVRGGGGIKSLAEVRVARFLLPLWIPKRGPFARALVWCKDAGRENLAKTSCIFALFGVKKKKKKNLERKGISQANLFRESFTERWWGWDKVSCHLVTPHTADLYNYLLSILLFSQKKWFLAESFAFSGRR